MLPRRLNGRAIAIAPVQPPIRRTRGQNGCRVSTPTGSRVDVAPAGGGPQGRQHLWHHHWLVSEFWHCALLWFVYDLPTLNSCPLASDPKTDSLRALFPLAPRF